MNSNSPLPVIDLLNNVRTISNFLYTSQQTLLSANITTLHPSLSTDFEDWQQDIYNEYFQGFLNENLISQPDLINELYNDGLPTDSMQSLINGILTPVGMDTPNLITLADSISNLITTGSAYASSLETIAEQIQGADQQKVDALMATVASLSSQFDQQEDKLVSGSFKLGTDIVVTAVNVAIAVGSEGETVQPLIKSVSQIGTDVINELNLKDSINNTIAELQNAWNELDKESADLAQITLIVNQLKAVTTSASDTFAALDNIVTDWQTIADATNVSASEWASSGNSAFKEWSSRMVRVSFATATQTV